jgi:hypothetical protein
VLLQWPATHGPRADQPYFYRANQPEGREIKGVTGRVTVRGLIFFGGTEVPIVYTFLCRPSEDSLQRSAVPDGSLSQDSSPL